jgi:hypothetical protein
MGQKRGGGDFEKLKILKIFKNAFKKQGKYFSTSEKLVLFIK